LCADKGYDYTDVRQFVEQQGYIAHIKHRRKRGEPVLEECPMPGETHYLARRWVVERTFGWLTKRLSLRTAGVKNHKTGWLSFSLLALTFFGFSYLRIDTKPKRFKKIIITDHPSVLHPLTSPHSASLSGGSRYSRRV
jgi:transposase